MMDASAILALVQNQRGADAVARVLPNALISAVNLAEVIAKLVQKTGNPETVVRKLALLNLDVRAWTEASASHSARYAHLAAAGLSLGDRACITEASLSGVRMMTADRRWKEIPEIADHVDLIR